MRISKMALLPLLSISLLLVGCDTSSNESVPELTVIPNEEAVKGLDGKAPSTTESLPASGENDAPQATTENPVPAAGDTPVDPANPDAVQQVPVAAEDAGSVPTAPVTGEVAPENFVPAPDTAPVPGP